MPREPPVTTATRPDKLTIGETELLLDGALASGIHSVLTFTLGSGCMAAGFIDESPKERLREIVTLPGQLRMPLHAQHEPVATRVFHRFHQSVRRPGRRYQSPSQSFNGLMVVAVDWRVISAGELAEHAACQNTNAMRMAIARRPLLVFDCIRPLTLNVLNQCATAKNVKRLDAKADGEDRRAGPLCFRQRQQVGLVLLRDDKS